MDKYEVDALAAYFDRTADDLIELAQQRVARCEALFRRYKAFSGERITSEAIEVDDICGRVRAVKAIAAMIRSGACDPDAVWENLKATDCASAARVSETASAISKQAYELRKEIDPEGLKRGLPRTR